MQDKKNRDIVDSQGNVIKSIKDNDVGVKSFSIVP